MQKQRDVECLRDYAENGREAAFREIVNRHADVVYASALRQSGSPNLAQDIAQTVFGDLARKACSLAGTLDGDAALLGWLFRSTRFAALKQLRDDRRRQARERLAMQHLSPVAETAPEWERVQPALDDAMGNLSDDDREALLLRFFKNRDFRAIGETLGISDDAAQKRVSRALERLRTSLASRGVTTTAGALAAVLSANTIAFAPAGMAATLSTAALSGTAFATGATAATAMITLQKTLIVATLVAVVSTGIYQARQNSKLRGQNQALQQQRAALTEQNEHLTRERDDVTRQLAALRSDTERGQNTAELLRLRGQLARLQNNPNASVNLQPADSNEMESAAKDWLAKADLLKQRIEGLPDKKIPEIQFLTSTDWLTLALQDEPNADKSARNILYRVRAAAKDRFASMMARALRSYVNANADGLPDSLAHLKPYFDTPVEDAILDRYRLLRNGRVEAEPSEEMLVEEKAVVDDVQDTLYSIGLDRYNVRQSLGSTVLLPADIRIVPGARFTSFR